MMASLQLDKNQCKDLHYKITANFDLGDLIIHDDEHISYHGCEFFLEWIEVGIIYKFRIKRIQFPGSADKIEVAPSKYRKKLSIFLSQKINLKKKLIVDKNVQNYVGDSTKIFETLNRNINGGN